jgi:hypothetical protein
VWPYTENAQASAQRLMAAPTNPSGHPHEVPYVRFYHSHRAHRRFCEKNTCNAWRIAYLCSCPISHVPVVVCWLAGIRTRGRLTAAKGSAAGGEPANPAKRGTRLKATTDRAFSSLPASKAGLPKRLVFLAGRAERDLIPIQAMATTALDGIIRLVHGGNVRRRSIRPRVVP